MDDAIELLVTPTAAAVPVRMRITKTLTTVGSEPSADIRIATLPPRWAVLQRDKNGLEVRHLASGSRERLTAGARKVIDGCTLELVAPEDETEALPLEQLSEALCAATSADEALKVMLRSLVESIVADVGAIVVSETAGWRVAAAADRNGQPMEDPEAFLSDTIVADVLARSEPLALRDASKDKRYSQVHSVTALRLRSVLCVPMPLGGRAIGALFLGRQQVRAAFTDRHADELRVLASMAVPVLVQIRRAESRSTITGYEVIGECDAMREVRRMIDRVASVDLSVLVSGETGTGKEIVARAIHAASRRGARAIVAINCSAVPESLLSTELFGCRKGAFTGAVADRKGRIEEADGSTLFLDEVGDMPLAMQAALLRAIEQREVVRIGENVPRPVDFRVIAATHKNLDAEVAAGRFRADLLFRIREITITLPPLAQRGADIAMLAQLFLRQAEREFGLPSHRLTQPARAHIASYAWPGNVRELRAAMRRAALLPDDSEIRPEHLQLAPAAPASVSEAPGTLGDLDRTLDAAKDEYVGKFVQAVLAKHGGNRERAAISLGISVRSLYRILGGE